jgi:hypothetical protein
MQGVDADADADADRCRCSPHTEILAPSVEAFFLDRKMQDKNLRPMNLHLG